MLIDSSIGKRIVGSPDVMLMARRVNRRSTNGKRVKLMPRIRTCGVSDSTLIWNSWGRAVATRVAFIVTSALMPPRFAVADNVTAGSALIVVNRTPVSRRSISGSFGRKKRTSWTPGPVVSSWLATRSVSVIACA